MIFHRTDGRISLPLHNNGSRSSRSSGTLREWVRDPSLVFVCVVVSVLVSVSGCLLFLPALGPIMRQHGLFHVTFPVFPLLFRFLHFYCKDIEIGATWKWNDNRKHGKQTTFLVLSHAFPRFFPPTRDLLCRKWFAAPGLDARARNRGEHTSRRPHCVKNSQLPF